MAIDSLTKDLIQPGDRFYSLLNTICQDASVLNVIHTGAGMGDGASKAIVTGLSRKATSETVKYIPIELSTIKFSVLNGAFNQAWVTPINGNAIATADYLDDEGIITAYFAYPTDVRYTNTDRLTALKDEELDYISKRVGLTDEALTEAITQAITVDLAVINGSEFSSQEEFDLLIAEAPTYVALYDTNNLKNKRNEVLLSENVDYDLYSSGIDHGIYWAIYKQV